MDVWRNKLLLRGGKKLTAEEIFYDLSKKYGDSFNWHMIPLLNRNFVAELKREIGQNHFLYHREIWAVAKCDSNDDVLFVTENEYKENIYYIVHLTYSGDNVKGYPQCKVFSGIEKVKQYIEETYVMDFVE